MCPLISHILVPLAWEFEDPTPGKAVCKLPRADRAGCQTPQKVCALNHESATQDSEDRPPRKDVRR